MVGLTFTFTGRAKSTMCEASGQCKSGPVLRIVMRRVDTKVRATTGPPDSTAADDSQSNRMLTKSLTEYRACPYEARFAALMPSIIHADHHSFRTHKVRRHRVRVGMSPSGNPFLLISLHVMVNHRFVAGRTQNHSFFSIA